MAGKNGRQEPTPGERLNAAMRVIERQRFAGGDPAVVLPADAAPAEIVARTLAAERLHAVLVIGEEFFNPGEDLAEAALRRAFAALRNWSFAAARIHLDEGAARSHEAPTQQRATLLKALTRLLSAIVYVPLHEKLRVTLAGFDDVVSGLDRLAGEERLHYRDEADRLLNLRQAAAEGDAFLEATWTLLRAQVALAAGQDEAALLWLARLSAQRLPSAPATGPDDEYLAGLLARTRQNLLAMILPADAEAGQSAPAEPVRPRELLNALAARLSATWGRDLAANLAIFAPRDYVAPELASNTPGARTKRRGQHDRDGT
jgi:hypothetical protein